MRLLTTVSIRNSYVKEGKHNGNNTGWTGLEPRRNIIKQTRDFFKVRSEHRFLGETGHSLNSKIFNVN